MTPVPDLTPQYFGWLIALFELVFAAYIIYLNPRNTANLFSGAFVFLLAVISFAIASLAGSGFPQSAETYAAMLAASIPALHPLELIALLAIFRPISSQANRTRWLKWAAGAAALLPALLTLSDARTGWKLWFSSLPTNYSSGYLPFSTYTDGFISPAVYILNFILAGIGVFALLVGIIFFERDPGKEKRQAATWLVIANFAASIGFLIQVGGNSGAFLIIGAALFFLAAFGFLVSREIISESRSGGSLRLRLTALALIVAIPMISGISIFLTEQSRRSLTESATQSLQTANSSVLGAMTLWVDYNSRALQILVSNPDTITMNSLWQKPLLHEMVENYPHMYLVSTVDVNGVNKARSDDQPLETYKDRFWFQNALRGEKVTYEALIGKTSGQPSLVVSMPIYREDGSVVGVGMFASELRQVSKVVQGIHLGEGGSIFVIDQRNVLVSHSDPNAALLANMGGNEAVKTLRTGQSGAFAYSDAKGQRIQAYIDLLPNGWGVITQQTEAGLYKPIRQIQQLAFTILVIGAALMSLLSWSTIRQALRPVQVLTETARAISQGDLSRHAVTTSDSPDEQDELGTLAHSFNSMTDQLTQLIGGLESRVAERTANLERRALQFQVTAEVAREAAAIRDPERLFDRVVGLISERFGFDHAGIFLVEARSGFVSEPGENKQGFAVLRAASSEGGERMLKRGHRLRIGREGIVGFAAATGTPRIALDVGGDAVYFNNPDLPLTRSEVALPLKVKDVVIGVLDVQSNKPSAFSEEDLEILQILADQVALAIENTRLLGESRVMVHELETQYARQIRQGWEKRLGSKPLMVYFDRSGNRRSSDLQGTSEDHNTETGRQTDLIVPIELRGQRIGALRLRKEKDSKVWSETEQNLVRETTTQLALSLENARLLEEIRSQANQEEMINKIVSQTQSSLGLDNVMKKAVLEIGRLMRLSRVQIRLGADTIDSVSVPPNIGNSAQDKKSDNQPSQEQDL